MFIVGWGDQVKGILRSKGCPIPRLFGLGMARERK